VTPIRRLPLLLLAALAVSACSEVDCAAPQRYHGAKLDKPLTTPEGLTPLEARDTHAVPGGEAPADYATGACLVKPPQLVAVPEPVDD
jgi:hypothetical protein